MQRRLHDYILFKDLDGKYMTLKDCIEQNKKEETRKRLPKQKKQSQKRRKMIDENKEPEKTTIYYVTDAVQQSQYINMFTEAGKNAVILSHNIDTAFISHLEQNDTRPSSSRELMLIVTEELQGRGCCRCAQETTETLTDLFRKSLGKEKLEVKVENLKNDYRSCNDDCFLRRAAECRI